MQLRLDGEDGQLSLDSAIEGFEEIVARATEFAGVAGLSLEATTMENLEAMGLMPALDNAASDSADNRSAYHSSTYDVRDTHSR